MFNRSYKKYFESKIALFGLRDITLIILVMLVVIIASWMLAGGMRIQKRGEVNLIDGVVSQDVGRGRQTRRPKVKWNSQNSQMVIEAEDSFIRYRASGDTWSEIVASSGRFVISAKPKTRYYLKLGDEEYQFVTGVVR